MHTVLCVRTAASKNQKFNKYKWVPKHVTELAAVTATGEKDDTNPALLPIKTCAYQIFDEIEQISDTKSMDRRWRMALNLFHRRCFTNDNMKVVFWDLSATRHPNCVGPSAMCPFE